MQQITITLTVSDLTAIVRQAVNAEMVLFQKKFGRKADCEILTRKEAAVFLKIDLSTLWKWSEDGKITKYGVGRRVYFKRSELEKCLIETKAA